MKSYLPISFLSALIPGGITLSFFMYFIFLTPHNGLIIPTHETLSAFFERAEIYSKIGMVFALIGVFYFAFRHIAIVVRNTLDLYRFKQKYIRLILREDAIMAIPLTYSITIYVIYFALSLILPSYWKIMNYLPYVALVLLLIIALFSIKIFIESTVTYWTNKSVYLQVNNSLLYMLSILTFIVVGIGFVIFGSISKVALVNDIGLFFSFIFIDTAIVILAAKYLLNFLAFRSR